MKRLLVMTVLALTACNSESSRVTGPGDDTPTPSWRDEQTEWFLRSISDDRTIAIVYHMSGVASQCQREGTAQVTESEDEVVIYAIKEVTTDRQRACTQELAYVDETVELKEPLGDRELRGCGSPTTDVDDEDAYCRDLDRSRNAGVFEFSPPPPSE